MAVHKILMHLIQYAKYCIRSKRARRDFYLFLYLFRLLVCFSTNSKVLKEVYVVKGIIRLSNEPTIYYRLNKRQTRKQPLAKMLCWDE